MKQKPYLKPECALPEAWLGRMLCSSDCDGSIESYDDLTVYEW